MEESVTPPKKKKKRSRLSDPLPSMTMDEIRYEGRFKGGALTPQQYAFQQEKAKGSPVIPRTATVVKLT